MEITLFFIKNTVHHADIRIMDGVPLFYTLVARKTCEYLSRSIVQATVAYSNESYTPNTAEPEPVICAP